jgi:hypothetical protein
MAEGIVDLLHAIDIQKEKKNSTPGATPNLQLAFRDGHEAPAVAQARKFIGQGEIAEFRLQHVLLRGALDCAHHQFFHLAGLAGVEQRVVLHLAHVLEQTGELPVGIGKQGLENGFVGDFFALFNKTRDIAPQVLSVLGHPQQRRVKRVFLRSEMFGLFA